MSNMSYCRHENTARDFEDVIDQWDDFDHEDASIHELRGRKRIIELVRDFAAAIEPDADDELERIDAAIQEAKANGDY